MLYNRNIVLDILRSNFWDPIEEFTNRCIMDMNGMELERFLEYTVDYANLDFITEMKVIDYEVEKEEDSSGESVSGTLEVSAEIDGYTHWDGEDILSDSGEITLGFSFNFYVEEGKYSDLELEYLY